MTFALSPNAKRILFVGKLAVLCALTLGFKYFDFHAAEDASEPHLFFNITLLCVIWACVLLPNKVFDTLPIKILSYPFLLGVPAAHFILAEMLIPRTRDINQKMLYLNIILYYLVFLVLLLLFRRHSQFAVLIGTVLSWLCGTVNCVVWQYRSLPVLPWDLYSTKTALSVAAEYQFIYTHLFCSIQLAFVCIAVLGFRLRLWHIIPIKALHWSLTGVMSAVLVGFLLFLQTDQMLYYFGGYPYLFTPTVYYERNGAAVAFLSTLHYLNVKRPAGYHADKLADEAALYIDEKPTDETDDYPNLIVIMNEAYSDLRALCDYSTNLPITPNIDALTENTIKGNLHVSVKGGNTANTEYEFLSGDSMAFLPSGSIPYQQHIKGETPNFTSHLKALGYRTEAIHPYYATGWMRDRVYPWFSFDDAAFIDAFQPLYSTDLLRGFVSDKTLFSFLIDRYEENEKNGSDPLFLFAVTMQNHGGYDQEYNNFHPDVTVDGIEEFKRISSYLSLIRKTDEAFASLVSYFADKEEKTVIVMFGDHQPNNNVVSTLMKNSGVDASSTALDAYNRYITPYLIWANYDLDLDAAVSEFHTEDISINYLSALVCRAAGIPLSGYQSFLASMQKMIPVITSKTLLDGETGEYADFDSMGELAQRYPALKTYQSFAYNHIFDTRHRIEDFFD